MKLTTRSIDALKPLANGPYEYSDDQTQGLYLRLGMTGVKSWVVRYTNSDGVRSKIGLGRYPAVGLAAARAAALIVAAQVVGGADPAREKRARRKARKSPRAAPRTLSDLWDVYERDVMPSKRMSTQRYHRWLWDRRIAPRLGSYDLSELDRAAVRHVLREIGRSGPTTANRALALLRHMLNVAVDYEYIKASPIARISLMFRESSRDRVLKEHELKLLWEALGDGGRWQVSERMCAAIKLALITGARGAEIVGLRAEEISVPDRLWTIPAKRFKGRRTHTIPLTALAMSSLAQAFGCPPAAWEGFAFPNAIHPDRSMERMSLSRAMQRIVGGVGLARATPHDLRRTMATFMASERIGLAPHAIAAVLGHVAEGPAVTRVYIRHQYDREKRAALEAWSRLLQEIVQSGESGGAVRVGQTGAS